MPPDSCALRHRLQDGKTALDVAKDDATRALLQAFSQAPARSAVDVANEKLIEAVEASNLADVRAALDGGARPNAEAKVRLLLPHGCLCRFAAFS